MYKAKTTSAQEMSTIIATKSIPTIVFVGAGPAGLDAAVQLAIALRERKQRYNIIMLEKYQEFQRTHTLDLNIASFKNSSNNERYRAVINSMVTSSSSKVPTNEIETNMRLLAESLDIKIIRGTDGHVKRFSDVMRDYPNADVIIGSDGSHSMVRAEVFNRCELYCLPAFDHRTQLLDDRMLPKSDAKHCFVQTKNAFLYLDREQKKVTALSTKLNDDFLKLLAKATNIQNQGYWLSKLEIETIQKATDFELPKKEMYENAVWQYLVEIKYQVEGKTRPLNAYPEAFLAASRGKHLVFESVGREKNGITPVSIRAIVDKETFDYLKNVSFRTPLNIADSDQLPPSLHQTFYAWLMARAVYTGEVRKNERITKTHLPVYEPKEFYTLINGLYVYLCGDAAGGIPYFRTHNKNLLVNPYLVEEIIKALTKKYQLQETASVMGMFGSMFNMGVSLITGEEHFNTKMHSIMLAERAAALAKDTYVNVKSSTVQSMQSTSLLSESMTSASLSTKIALTEENAKFKELMRHYRAEIANGKVPSLELFAMNALILGMQAATSSAVIIVKEDTVAITLGRESGERAIPQLSSSQFANFTSPSAEGNIRMEAKPVLEKDAGVSMGLN